ncbi:MAG: aspartate kinase [Flavobacteriaceae bacterium]|nr:aspartate kinase [Flavobacteriaceae bacterium]
MRIFKFGGASVKDAAGVKNLVKVLQHKGYTDTLVVVSAMGKMTNAFEKVIKAYIEKDKNLDTQIAQIKKYHTQIIGDLFTDRNHPILFEIEHIFGLLKGFMLANRSTNYNFIYDQLVGFGEMLSTKIISNYLNEIGVDNQWLDVRQVIVTSDDYRDAKVDWDETKYRISNAITKGQLYITQGFLGATKDNFTTTLGREGSDYTAAIFAYSLNAADVTIWKDVQGVLNADPREFKDTKLLNQISYKEAIEMAFYGASVIHPKTLKPLENSSIPLYVRSFIDLKLEGTQVKKGEDVVPLVPCFVVKKEQIYLQISALDFSFMVEHNIGNLFQLLDRYKLKVNLIQNSALSFRVCLEDKYTNFEAFIEEIRTHYRVEYSENVTLFTIRHFTEEAVNEVEKDKEIVLKQISESTIQLIVK